MEEYELNFWFKLGQELKILKKIEEEKIPYHLNLIDELHANENAHTRILLKLLKYKTGGRYPFVESFLGMMSQKCSQYPFPIDAIQELELTFDKEKIDLLIEDRDHRFAVIVENKIQNAADQQKQIERYIEKVRSRVKETLQIWVIYLTSDGTKQISSFSLTQKAQEMLSMSDEDNGRFVEINYKDDILEWLMNQVLPEIKHRDELMICAIQQYIDYLRGRYNLRINQKDLRHKMEEKIKEALKLTDVKESIQWQTICESELQLSTILNALNLQKRHIVQNLLMEWESAADNSFGTKHNNQIENGFYQLFIEGLPTWIHFEWIPLHVNDLFFKNELTIVLHAEGNQRFHTIQRLIRNEAFKKVAYNLGYEITLKDSGDRTAIRKTYSTGNKTYFELTSIERNQFLENVYKEVSVICNVLQGTFHLIEKDVEWTADLLKTMKQIDSRWGEYQGWDLCLMLIKDGRKIGIESSFVVNEQQKKEYRIYITTWDKKSWTPEYAEKLRAALPEAFDYMLDDKQESNRVYLHIPPIPDSVTWHDEIVKELTRIYEILKDIVEQ